MTDSTDTDTDEIRCDHCDEAIDDDSLILIRERDDAVRAVCPRHLEVKNIQSYKANKTNNGEET